MGIPPGHQNPFSKYRSYGQEPGFISRNSGKLFIVMAVLVLLGIAYVFFSSIREAYEPNEDQQTTLQLDLH